MELVFCEECSWLGNTVQLKKEVVESENPVVKTNYFHKKACPNCGLASQLLYTSLPDFNYSPVSVPSVFPSHQFQSAQVDYGEKGPERAEEIVGLEREQEEAVKQFIEECNDVGVLNQPEEEVSEESGTDLGLALDDAGEEDKEGGIVDEILNEASALEFEASENHELEPEPEPEPEVEEQEPKVETRVEEEDPPSPKREGRRQTCISCSKQFISYAGPASRCPECWKQFIGA